MNSVNKNDFIMRVAENMPGSLNGDLKAARDFVTVYLNELTKALVDGDRLTFAGFGTFDSRDVPAHSAHNPRTGESVDVPDSRRVVFRAGRNLKDAVAGVGDIPPIILSGVVPELEEPEELATPARAVKKAPARKAAAKKSPAKKAPAKTAVKKSTTAAAKKTVAKKAPAKTAAKKTTTVAAKKTVAKKAPAKTTAKKAPAKRTPAKKVTTAKGGRRTK